MRVLFSSTSGYGHVFPMLPLAALPVRLLVTVGPDGDPAALGDQPPHVHVERWVHQPQVLDH